MTNPIKFAKSLVKAQGKGSHEHVPLTNVRAGVCQEHPEASCDDVCLVVEEEMQDKHGGEECRSTAKLFLAMVGRGSHLTDPQGHAEREPQYHGDNYRWEVRRASAPRLGERCAECHWNLARPGRTPKNPPPPSRT